jgi:hypothetical protein
VEGVIVVLANRLLYDDRVAADFESRVSKQGFMLRMLVISVIIFAIET